MNSPPPVIPPQPPPLPSTRKPFAFQAAQASLLAPLTAVGVSIVVNVGMANQASPSAKIITGSLCILLIVLGFVFGIVSLFGVRRHGKKGILGRAIAGICINGILIALMVISIPGLMKAAARAKEMRQRQNSEQQQTQP
jgi:ABC-type molybdate transport system permease subunit